LASSGNTANEQKILAKLDEILSDILDVDRLNLSFSSSAADVEGWDSFTNIKFIIATESHYKVRFTTSDVLALRNIGEFIELIIRSNSPVI